MPTPSQLPRLWEFPLTSPNWRTRSSPVWDSPEGCYIWARLTVHRLDHPTGDIIWSWTPARSYLQGGIRDGPQSPAVQVGGHSVYVRQGNSLSCLRSSDGAPRWEHQQWSDITGNFLLANDLIVIDSYRPQGRALLGPAALTAETGELAWHLEEPYFHVVSMAATGAVLVLVECNGIGGSGGSRVRLLDLSLGETLAVNNLVGPVEPEASLFRPRRPLIMPDGSIVIWSHDSLSPYSEAFCFDSQLAPRWNRLIQVGNIRYGPGPSGNNFLIGAGDDLLAFQADCGGDRRAQQGWTTRVDLETGELIDIIDIKEFPDNRLPLNAVSVPDGSVVFVVASHSNGNKESATRWNLMAMNPDSGEISYLGPKGASSNDLTPLAPVATSGHLYLQVPQTRTRSWGRSTGDPAASIIAFQLV